MRRFAALLIALLIAPGLPGARADEPAAASGPAHAIAMHGTPKYPAGFPHFDYVDPAAPKGGKFKVAATGGFDSFNGFIPKGEAADGLGQIYDTLLTTSADEPFTAYGLLAESIETPADRSWVRFRLRAEARWHDGKPVTADDVVWTFNTLIEKGSPQYKFYYGGVEKAVAEDERTVLFTFKPGDNRELPLILGQIAILPKHYWETRDFAKSTLEPPLGSGPYRVKDFEPPRYVTYERVPDYWGRGLNVTRGRFNFDLLEYDYYRDRTVQVEAFKAGEFDFRAENISKVWATAYDTPEVARGWIRKKEFPHQRVAGMQGFVYNERRDLFKDRLVRRALAYAFDFAWTNRNLFYGQYTRSRSYFGNSELEAKGLPEGDELALLNDYREQLPPELFTREYNPPATRGDGRIRDNLCKAQALLKQAGWEVRGADLYHAETGRKFEFELLLVSPSFERIALPFKKNLKRLGITMNVRTVDTAQYIERLRRFDYDMITSIWGISQSPGNEQRNYWGSAAADTPDSQNYPGIKNPVVDALIEKLIQAKDRDSLVSRVRALDRVLQWGYHLVPHWHLDYDRLIFWNKFGYPDTIPEQGMQIDTWWYDKEKAETLARARAGGREN
jgi:microcin C transport system substrate-binding protein